jgi:hypothetical protein
VPMTATHHSREARKLCERCWQRKARFQYHGVVRADRHHTLCFECFRSERDRRRARLLVAFAGAEAGTRRGLRDTLLMSPGMHSPAQQATHRSSRYSGVTLD